MYEFSKFYQKQVLIYPNMNSVFFFLLDNLMNFIYPESPIEMYIVQDIHV